MPSNFCSNSNDCGQPGIERLWMKKEHIIILSVVASCYKVSTKHIVYNRCLYSEEEHIAEDQGFATLTLSLIDLEPM
jgi:hypothetical protein